MRNTLLYFLFLLSVSSFSQNEETKWYFGYNAALDFSTNPPTILTNTNSSTTKGSASTADAAGNLLFYTDGHDIYTSTHTLMANGAAIYTVSNSITQGNSSELIVKQPGSSTLYYVFNNGLYQNGTTYCIIDMSLAAGSGSVTVRNATLNASTFSNLGITGTKHCNGIDYWIIVPSTTFNSNISSSVIKSFLLSSSGINTTPIVSSATTFFSESVLKISPNGKRLAVSNFNQSANNPTVSTLSLYDFDNTNGSASNYQSLTTQPGLYASGFYTLSNIYGVDSLPMALSCTDPSRGDFPNIIVIH